MVDPDCSRISDLVEGFHRGFKMRVNRARPTLEGSEVLLGCTGGASQYRFLSVSSCCWAYLNKLVNVNVNVISRTALIRNRVSRRVCT